MKVRTILYPMNGQDVSVMQALGDDGKYFTMPLVSATDLSDEELQEIASTLDANEVVVEKYLKLKREAQSKPDVVETTSEPAAEVTSGEMA